MCIETVPKLASLYLTHHWDGEVKGLDAFGDKIPPVAPVFFAFRIMVGWFADASSFLD